MEVFLWASELPSNDAFPSSLLLLSGDLSMLSEELVLALL